MSEGEFKKRLKQRTQMAVVYSDEVKEWLNEARKEFPKLPTCNPNTADRINHSIECIEWALKWFGNQ